MAFLLSWLLSYLLAMKCCDHHQLLSPYLSYAEICRVLLLYLHVAW